MSHQVNLAGTLERQVGLGYMSINHISHWWRVAPETGPQILAATYVGRIGSSATREPVSKGMQSGPGKLGRWAWKCQVPWGHEWDPQ